MAVACCASLHRTGACLSRPASGRLDCGVLRILRAFDYRAVSRCASSSGRIREEHGLSEQLALLGFMEPPQVDDLGAH
jgi:hypothetical protein